MVALETDSGSITVRLKCNKNNNNNMYAVVRRRSDLRYLRPSGSRAVRRDRASPRKGR